MAITGFEQVLLIVGSITFIALLAFSDEIYTLYKWYKFKHRVTVLGARTNRDLLTWLDVYVGVEGTDWRWRYVGTYNNTSFWLHPDIEIAFKDAKYTTLFLIRWG